MRELRGVIRDYAWGDRRAIAEILGHTPPGHPEAEYWLGAHPSAPGQTLGPDGKQPLDALIDQDPQSIIGPAVADRFPRLPYLLKILAADQPLSIQAHPSLEDAKAGFARENREGIDVAAPNRSYRDDNHKPELICALTPFEAKCGFRSAAETCKLIELLDTDGLDPLARRLGDPTSPSGLERDSDLLAATVAWLLRLPAGEASKMAKAAVVAAASPSSALLAEFESEARWTVRIGEAFPGDVGVLVGLLLNHVSLEPGQAIFLEAGNLHSYLHGVGIELMANSDNVLRGGLTGKHIDVEELLGVVDYRPSVAPVQSVGSAVHRFDVPVPEFGLTRIDSTMGDLGDLSFEVVGPEILLVTSGAITVEAQSGAQSSPRFGSDSEWLTLSAGSAGFISHADGDYRLIDEAPGETVAWRATVGDTFGL